MFKRLYYLSFAGYLFFFIFSVVFFKERSIFIDIAYHTFLLVKDNTFVPNMRFGAAATQIYPLLAIRSGLPLDNIILAYSVGFVCYHFLYFVICGLICKRFDFALVILLFNLLITSHTFYWVQSELPQGINFFILLLAIAGTKNTGVAKQAGFIIVLAGMLVVAFFHPLIIFPVGYAICFFLLAEKGTELINKRVLLAALGAFICFYVIKVLFFKVSYDAETMDRAVTSSLFDNFFGIHANKHFLQNCKQRYYWIPILTLAIMGWYGYKKQWLKLSLFAFAMVGYTILVNVTHPKGDVPDFYMENLYLPLGVFIAFPFVFDLLPVLQKKFTISWVPEVVVCLIMLTGCVRILGTHSFYTDRLNWERAFLQANAGKKLIIDGSKAPREVLLDIWGTPFEFWLLSTTEGGSTASVMINNSPNNYKDAYWLKKCFVTTWANYSYSDLPKRYFNFKDTTTSYELMK